MDRNEAHLRALLTPLPEHQTRNFPKTNVDIVTLKCNAHDYQKQERLAVPTFLPGDDQIACMNKAMAFLSDVFTPHYPSTNIQLRSSSNPKNQATIQGHHSNFQGEGHMARQCTQPKRRRNATWFKEKVLLVQAQTEGKELDEEKLEFLADPGVADGQVS
ncbi:hypothetical protein Tco_0525216 [Tanacetum coccineum]